MNLGLREISSTSTKSGKPGRPAGLTPDARAALREWARTASSRRNTRQVCDLIEQSAERQWFWRLVKLEVERARRQGTTFTMLSLRQGDARSALELADRLQPQLRATDAIVPERDRTLILLGDTPPRQASAALRRLTEGKGVLPADVECTEISFPRDALTFGALIERLHDQQGGERLLPTG